MLALRRPAVAARGRYSGHVAPTCACRRLLVMPWRASNGRSRGGPTRAAATPTAGSYRADIRRLHDLRRNPGPGVLVSAPRELLRPRANMTVDPRSGRLIFAQELVRTRPTTSARYSACTPTPALLQTLKPVGRRLRTTSTTAGAKPGVASSPEQHGQQVELCEVGAGGPRGGGRARVLAAVARRWTDQPLSLPAAVFNSIFMVSTMLGSNP